MNASLDVVCNFINTNLRIVLMRNLLCHTAIALSSFFNTRRSTILEFNFNELIYSSRESFQFEFLEFQIQQIFGVKSNLLIPAD